jgi:hypothetical protein
VHPRQSLGLDAPPLCYGAPLLGSMPVEQYDSMANALDSMANVLEAMPPMSAARIGLAAAAVDGKLPWQAVNVMGGNDTQIQMMSRSAQMASSIQKTQEYWGCNSWITFQLT